MAQTLGEAVGETVGLRVRLGSKISRKTRIEVVTEGVFARMILDDPALDGVAAVLFDEFHERSLDADLGLALALDAQGGLREDLRLLVMSATLDGARVARLLGEAPVIESEGRAYPVETRYLGRDPEPAHRGAGGGCGHARPAGREPAPSWSSCRGRGRSAGSRPFCASASPIPPSTSRRSTAPSSAASRISPSSPAKPGRRKVVLATSIAETSLTIEGVRVVIDSGLARVPVYEPNIGLTRLETVRVSRAAADQRRGRAGRTEPGVCYRLWEEAATGALEPFARPEILSADLSPLLLDCAAWGVADPTALAFLDPPPAPALKEARALLRSSAPSTATGASRRRAAACATCPCRRASPAWCSQAGESGQARDAADLAAVLVERGLGGDAVDLTERVERFRRDRSGRARGHAAHGGGLGRRRGATAPSQGRAAFRRRAADARLSRPHRQGARQAGRISSWPTGAAPSLEAHERLAQEPYLAIAEIAGGAASARILAAAAISPEEIEALFARGHRAARRDRLRPAGAGPAGARRPAPRRARS